MKFRSIAKRALWFLGFLLCLNTVHAMEKVTYSGDPASPAGYLCVPEGAGPFPAVVYQHGGHGEGVVIGGAPKETCTALAEAGYVALSPIRRGVRPTPDSTIENRLKGSLDDAAAGIAYVRKLKYVDPDRVGMIGMSLGGYMSLVLLSENAPVKAAVLMGAPDLSAKRSDFPFKELLPKIKVPVLGMVSKFDTGSRETGGMNIYEQMQVLTKDATEAGVKMNLIVYGDWSGHKMFFSIGDYWKDVVTFLDAEVKR